MFDLKHLKRIFGLLAVALTTFVSGTTVTTPAYAHCGDHADSCGAEWDYPNYWCKEEPGWPSGWAEMVTWYHLGHPCSGTCYNGNQGCCDSPAACNDAPCKPGGCSSDTCIIYQQDFYTGNPC